uniref:transmembrane emp24 domain-containing protein A-like isoform X1 n=1 Tax=Styela clava TaxID=7725 RepID=UPI00193AAE56|nr:transmembrane emp24 domain-containing protein A-like isoform X1 [Styela clava]
MNICYILLFCAIFKNSRASKDAMELYPPSADALLFNPLSPVIKREFSVMLNPRDIDCYFHYIPTQAKVQFQYRVITPGSTFFRNIISAEIISPNGESFFKSYNQDRDDSSDIIASESGVYKICLQNTQEKFGGKKVRVLFSYINEATIKQIAKERNETGITTDNMVTSSQKLAMIAMRIYSHLYYQKLEDASNMEQMISMLEYIDRSSVFICLIIVVLACFQTLALKHMLRECASNKQRA